MKGDAIDLSEVNDEMFAERLLGDGIAIIPKEENVYSPVNGMIKVVYETQHMIGMELENGTEIIIHMGIDTVMLKGKPFNTKVKVGDKVKQGDLLTVVDWHYIKHKGYDITTPIITIKKKVRNVSEKRRVVKGDLLFEIIDE
jgi:glucose-specific phosphotransferase system IIA component